MIGRSSVAGSSLSPRPVLRTSTLNSPLLLAAQPRPRRRRSGGPRPQSCPSTARARVRATTGPPQQPASTVSRAAQPAPPAAATDERQAPCRVPPPRGPPRRVRGHPGQTDAGGIVASGPEPDADHDDQVPSASPLLVAPVTPTPEASSSTTAPAATAIPIVVRRVSPSTLPVRATAYSMGQGIRMTPRGDGGLYVATPDGEDTLLVALDDKLRVRPGWPLLIEGRTCEIAADAGDGSVRAVCGDTCSASTAPGGRSTAGPRGCPKRSIRGPSPG